MENRNPQNEFDPRRKRKVSDSAGKRRRKRRPGPASRALKQYYQLKKCCNQNDGNRSNTNTNKSTSTSTSTTNSSQSNKANRNAITRDSDKSFEHKFNGTGLSYEFKKGDVDLVTPRVHLVKNELSSVLSLKIVCAAPQKKKTRARHNVPDADDIPDTARIDLRNVNVSQ
jgi:hypothetical protein